MPLPIIAGAIAAGAGLFRTISGAIQTKKYRDLIENYQRQTLRNPYGHLKVSTLGAMFQQRNAAQQTATALYNLRQSGANAIFGNVGKVVKQNYRVNEKVAANLDQQLARNELYKARGAMTVQQMGERREEQDLAGLGTALNVSQQNMYGGMSDIMQGALVAGGGIKGAAGGKNNFFSDALKSTRSFDFKSGLNQASALGATNIDWTQIGGGSGFDYGDNLGYLADKNSFIKY